MSTQDHELETRVEQVLRRTRDRRTEQNVFEAGVVEDVRVEERRATVTADFGGFDPRSEKEVMDAILAAVRDVDGIEGTHVEPVAPDASVDGDRVSTANIDNIIAVASTKGGVGKSTVAANLACALAADQDVALFDADIFGPNAVELLDVEGPVVADENDRPIPVDADGLEVMSVGLLTDGGPLAWRGAMAHDALSDLFGDVAWDDPDTLVIDLPPGTSDVILTTLQEVPIDGVVVVTTPFHTSVADTVRSLRLFDENEVPVLGLVQNMRTFTCPSCGDEHELYPGETDIDEFDLPTLARLPFDTEMQSTPRSGDVPAPFHRLATDAQDRLEEIWNPDVPDDAVDIRGLPSDVRRRRVEESFVELDAGEEFVLLSDRDPSPVHDYLAELASRDDSEDPFETFRVRKQNPETWVLRTVRP